MSRHFAQHISGILPFAHQLLQRALTQGAVALDATSGNGYDTVHLAQCVGAQGKIYALDIQAAAAHATRTRLQQYGLLDRVDVIHASHTDVAQYVPNNLQAAIFNLGYLPGSDKTITTQAQTTIIALQHTIQLLAYGGILIVVAYRGHAKGADEYAAIHQWATQLPDTQAVVAQYALLNLNNNPPVVFAIEKIKHGTPLCSYPKSLTRLE